MSGARIRGLLIDAAYACDIDTPDDWRHAEWLMRHLDQPFVRPRSATP